MALSSSSEDHVKNPDKVRAGQIGMRSRWGPQRWVKLTDLAPPVRAAVEALVAADAKAKAGDAG